MGPPTPGKIKRCHQALKNTVLLANYFLPRDLKNQIKAFVERYDQRPPQSLNHFTPEMLSPA
jgi:hypothetical protein